MKSKAPSIKINFIYTLAYQVLALIVPLITTPYVSRIFTSGNIGSVSYATSICNYFLLFGNLGMATYAQLQIARNRANKHSISTLFVEIVIARTTTMLVSLFCYMGFIGLAGQDKMMFWVLSTNIIGSMFDCSWFFQGMEEFKKITLRNFAVKILSVILIFTCVKKVSDLYLYVLILYGSTIVANAYLWVGLRGKIEKVNFKELKIFRHYKGCFLYFIPTIASILNTSIGKTLLGSIGKKSSENGYFEQGYKIYSIIISIPASLNLVMRPRMAYLVGGNRVEEVRNKMMYSMRFILFMMVAISFGLIGTADNIVPWFLGAGWDKVSILLKLFSVCILFNSITLCFSEQYYLPFSRVNTLTVLLYTGSAVNVLMNVLLVSRWYSIGTTIATITAEFTVMSLAMFFSRRDVNIWAIAKISVKYFIAGGVMLAVLSLLNGHVPPTVYGFLLLMTAGFSSYLIVLMIERDQFVFDIFGQVIGFVKKIKNKL